MRGVPGLGEALTEGFCCDVGRTLPGVARLDRPRDRELMCQVCQRIYFRPKLHSFPSQQESSPSGGCLSLLAQTFVPFPVGVHCCPGSVSSDLRPAAQSEGTESAHIMRTMEVTLLTKGLLPSRA